MKILLCFILFSMLNVSGSIFSQNATFDLAVNGKTVNKVFKDIESQSDFRFLYNDDFAGLNRVVSFNTKDRYIEDVLNELLTGANLTYRELDNELIVITPLNISNQQQTVTLTGTVSDQAGNPIPGVSVFLEGTTIGTITDTDGNFSLSVPKGNQTLVFSFIGMITREVPIVGTQFDIVLEPDYIGLEEVVTIGYGTQRKVTLTGSVSTVSADFLENRPLTNSTQALQGVEGLYVHQVGGQPGNDVATIRIRGIGTFGSNDPLVLVDGVEYSLRDVNPIDIESISVLKDAASAAIYGNRAANGVILITTKSGQSTERINVEFNTYFGLQQATYLPDMVTSSVDWMTSRNQAGINEGHPQLYTDEEIEAFRTATDPEAYPNTDWYGIMYSTKPMYDHNLRMSGGSEITTYSFSLGYLNQEGVLLGTDAKRYSLNSNITFNLSDALKFGAIINASNRERNEGPTGATGSGGLAGAITRALPIHPAKFADGRYGDTHLSIPGHNVFNPVLQWAESDGFWKFIDRRALINFIVEYDLPLNIQYKANFAVNKFDAQQHRFMPELFLHSKLDPDRIIPSSRRPRHVSRLNNDNMNTSFFQTLNWTTNIVELHNVNLLLGFSREAFSNSNFNSYIEGFVGNELTELNAGTINQSVGGTSNESRLMSYFGRANYNFSDKYLLEFNFRYDGSSRFAQANRWGFFPSFSGAWRISEENFIKNIDALYELKLRGSWGQLGNQSIALYSFASNININQGHTFNNNIVGGSAVTTLADPNITWETTTMTNIGLDVALWNNKLIFNIDAFNKVTTDILTRINIPGQVGDLTGPITNLYGMSNKGIEISTDHRNSIGSLTFRIGGQISFVENNVDYLDGAVQYRNTAQGFVSVTQEGYPVNSWFLYEALGIFQTQEEVDNHAFQHPATSPGDIKYRDLNGDGVIDINDMRVVGNSVPKYTYGFTLDLGYKGFDLSAFFQGVQGIDMYPIHNVGWPQHNGAGITKDWFYNSWTPENPSAKYPRFFLPKRGTQINSKTSTFWLEDASYLRMKNLQLGYTISSELINRLNISKLRVYLNAQNALTFSNWTVTDPEKNIQGLNVFEYPGTKIFSLGLNVNF